MIGQAASPDCSVSEMPKPGWLPQSAPAAAASKDLASGATNRPALLRSAIGPNTAVDWPVGQGGKGNEGVTATVKQVPNSIGYVEYAYAKQNKLAHTLLQNKAGKFVAPEAAAFEAAAAGANWSSQPGFGISLTNQPGDASWPITAPTFVLIPKTPKDAARNAAVIKFFDWAYKSGAKLASDLDYVALPEKVAADVRTKAFGQAGTQ